MNYSEKHERFVKKVFERFGDEYSILGEYRGYDYKVKIKHNICDHEWEVWSGNLFNKKYKCCPKCSNKIRLNTETFSNKVKELTNGEYKVLGEYVNTDIHVEMMHIICGHKWSVIPNNFFNHTRRCPNCAGLAKYTIERFQSKIFELTGKEYSLIGDCVNGVTETMVKHNICGAEFSVSPTNFINHERRCPECYPLSSSKSKGELKILGYLKSNGIPFIEQYSFDDCADINKLLFDFAIFSNSKKNKLKLLIEFDGGQHYYPVDFFGGEEGFKKQIKRDEIKNTYCRDNNIPLLRIPYWEFDNIENILNKEFKKLKIKTHFNNNVIRETESNVAEMKTDGVSIIDDFGISGIPVSNVASVNSEHYENTLDKRIKDKIKNNQKITRYDLEEAGMIPASF